MAPGVLSDNVSGLGALIKVVARSVGTLGLTYTVCM